MLVLSVILSALKQLIFDISVFLSTLLFISAFKWLKQSIFFSLLFFLHLNDLNDRYFFFLHLKDQYFCFHAFCFIFLLIFLRLNNSNDVYMFFLYCFLHSIDVCSFWIFFCTWRVDHFLCVFILHSKCPHANNLFIFLHFFIHKKSI